MSEAILDMWVVSPSCKITKVSARSNLPYYFSVDSETGIDEEKTMSDKIPRYIIIKAARDTGIVVYDEDVKKVFISHIKSTMIPHKDVCVYDCLGQTMYVSCETYEAIWERVHQIQQEGRERSTALVHKCDSLEGALHYGYIPDGQVQECKEELATLRAELAALDVSNSTAFGQAWDEIVT